MTAQGFRPNQMYEIVAPKGAIHTPPEGRCWSMIESEFKKLLEAKRIYFGKDKNSQPNVIRYMSEIEGFVPWSWWPSNEVGHTDEAKKEIHSFFGKSDAFDTPKPVRLINRILEIATLKDSIILDSFAGSGTTAHAVLNLNKQDGGNRKFILVEMEEYAETITAERVKRVINGYGNVEGTGGSFSYCTLGSPLFLENNNFNEQVGVDKIRQYIYYSETKQNLTMSTHGAADHPSFLGTYNNSAYYFHYQVDELTTLNLEFLGLIQTKADQYIIYADTCFLEKEFMLKHSIVFKKIPRDITRF
jgi:adenine-specific DNA-methyltransferase